MIKKNSHLGTKEASSPLHSPLSPTWLRLEVGPLKDAAVSEGPAYLQATYGGFCSLNWSDIFVGVATDASHSSRITQQNVLKLSQIEFMDTFCLGFTSSSWVEAIRWQSQKEAL